MARKTSPSEEEKKRVLRVKNTLTRVLWRQMALVPSHILEGEKKKKKKKKKFVVDPKQELLNTVDIS